MEAYDRIEQIRLLVGDSAIVDVIISTYSTDQLNDLCDILCNELSMTEDY